MAYSFLVHGDRAALSSFPGTQESTAIWHLTAFYLAAAIAASLGSHLHANLVSLPRFLSRLTTAARAGAPLARAELFPLARKAQLNGSVGASGALYAILAIGALAFPAAQVGIVFVPFVSLPIPLAVGALCALDLVGVVRGWQTFNHAAHLAGAVFGGLYWRYGVRHPLSRRPPARSLTLSRPAVRPLELVPPLAPPSLEPQPSRAPTCDPVRQADPMCAHAAIVHRLCSPPPARPSVCKPLTRAPVSDRPDNGRTTRRGPRNWRLT